MYAIEGEKLENVQLLLRWGADVQKTNKDGNTFRVHLGIVSKKKEKKISKFSVSFIAAYLYRSVRQEAKPGSDSRT